MKRLASIRSSVAITLMLGLGIVTALASSADASSGQLGVLTRRGLSLERAHAALATQSQVETAELAPKLEAALGASFAGVWFEPDTAKFCIGVVSGASRRAAEQVVAQAGLAGVVSYVSVRSTWAQLISAQSEWNVKLARLLAGQQASTGLTASNNAVSVTLSSSVPEHERARLEREAADAHVNVSITIVPPQALAAKPRNSQCEFKRAEAYCSKPIVAGVLITPENNAKPEKYCTAGPLAILPNPTTLAAELETLLITAGHCTNLFANWFSSLHPGKETEPLGPTVKSLWNLIGDYGAIALKSNWLEVGTTPALAQMTHYQDTGLREAQSVLGEAASVQNSAVCKQGATSAEQCGAITSTNVLFRYSVGSETQDVDGLVRTNACGEQGDSGGPYATLPSSNGVDILGIEVAGPTETCSGLFCPKSLCDSYYEPIKTALTGLKLELLTTTNQTRHRSKLGEPEFIPVGASVESTTGTTTFEAAGNKVTCAKSTQKGGTVSSNALVGNIVIKFENCQGKEGAGAECATMSPGAGESEIVTKTLHAVLGLALLPGKPTDPAILFLPVTGKQFTIILSPCLIETALEGNVAGLVSPVGVKVKEGKIVFAQTGGVQNIGHFLPSTGGLVLPRLLAFGASATEETTATVTYSMETEIT
jgi:hypothetical protein